MKEQEEKYSIKSATGIESVIVMLVAVFFVGNAIYNYGTTGGGLLYAGMLVLIYCLWLSVLGVIRVIKKPTELKLGRDTMVTDGHTLQPSDIDRIFINGFSRKLIGIKLKGKRIVPARWAFKFHEDQEDSVKDLIHWAEMNKIPMEDKKFFKWI